MPEAEIASLIEMTAELVAAYVARNAFPAPEMPRLIATVHACLAGLGAAPEAKPESKPVPPVSIRKTVTDDYIISLEDGRPYRSLKRHLGKHGLTPADYRAR